MSSSRFALEPVPGYHTVSADGVTLHVNLTVLDTLQALIQEGLRALPRRGVEMGGLLYGSDETNIRVEAVRPIRIEHQSGPAFELSEADLELFREAIGDGGHRSGAPVIGHFRSHTQGEVRITVADRTIAGLIEKSNPLMLLIQGSPAGPRTAELYRENGGESSILFEFPLPAGPAPRPTILPVPVPPDPEPHRSSAVEMLASRPERPATAAPRPPTAPRRWWLAWLLAGLLAFAAIVSYSLWRKVVSAPEQNLGMSVDQTAGGSLRVSWSRSNAAVVQAVSGVLTIHDGDYDRRFDLSASELRSATILYQPQSATVQMRLEINHENGGFIGQSVTVLRPAAGKTAAGQTGNPPSALPSSSQPAPRGDASGRPRSISRNTAVPPTPKPGDAIVEMPRKQEVETGRSTPPAPVDSGPAERAEPARSASLIPPASPAGQLVSPAPASRQTSSAEGAPSSLGTAAPVSPQTVPAQAESRQGGSPPAASPQSAPPTVASNPVALPPAGSPQAVPPTVAPPPAAPSPSSFVPAKVARKIAPGVPEGLRSMVRSSVTVDVQVTIDARGKVTSAKPLHVVSPFQTLLVPSAVRAAQGWLFEPAMRDGHPVESEITISFDFDLRPR